MARRRRGIGQVGSGSGRDSKEPGNQSIGKRAPEQEHRNAGNVCTAGGVVPGYPGGAPAAPPSVSPVNPAVGPPARPGRNGTPTSAPAQPAPSGSAQEPQAPPPAAGPVDRREWVRQAVTKFERPLT